MSNLRSFFAFALTLSLLGIASPVLAQGDTTMLDPNGSTLVLQTEEPPPPDDGDKDFDEWDNDILNLTSPSLHTPSSDTPSSADPFATRWTAAVWLEALRDWLDVGAR